MQRKTNKKIFSFLTLLPVIVAASMVHGYSILGEENCVFEDLLKDSMTSSFTTDTDIYEVDFLGMCDGTLLDFCRVSDEYGMRRHPVFKRRYFHTGMDLAAPRGSYVYAPSDGVVERTSWAGGYGRTIDLDHGFSWETRYGHLKKIYVKKGDQVKKGDIIGEVGNSGRSTGPHLHFEVRYMNQTVDPRSHFDSLDMTGLPNLAFANR